MILVPVKNLVNAKQRLADVMEQSARTELAHAMLEDVLEALAESAADEVSLVTSDAFALELAGHHRFAVIHDESNLSETAAIEMATRVCESRGIQSTLVIPADIPLIEAADIRAIYKSAPAKGTVLVPAADQRGTNAALRCPAALFPLRFGNDSFMPHLVAAIATRATCVVLSVPRIALDIDTPEDLQQLVNAGSEKRSQRLARKFGFSEALAADV
jgi:2-phospho-L-lactate guanylyltransferase